jgi:hypothetical protein
MALQGSGAISLDDIHVEAGGTTGTTVSINDADVRALISAASGATMDFADFYDASQFNETHVLTQASITSNGREYNGKFISGSISPTTLNGYNILYLYKNWYTSTNENTSDLWLYLSGEPPEDAFSTLEFRCTDGTIISLTSSEAVTAQGSSFFRWWTWSEADFTTQEHASFVATFDGSGDIELRITL